MSGDQVTGLKGSGGDGSNPKEALRVGWGWGGGGLWLQEDNERKRSRWIQYRLVGGRRDGGGEGGSTLTQWRCDGEQLFSQQPLAPVQVFAAAPLFVFAPSSQTQSVARWD